MGTMGGELYQNHRAEMQLACTVACPSCGMPAGRVCQGEGMWTGDRPAAVHVGRLKAAVPAPREKKYQWLDLHDRVLERTRAGDYSWFADPIGILLGAGLDREGSGT